MPRETADKPGADGRSDAPSINAPHARGQACVWYRATAKVPRFTLHISQKTPLFVKVRASGSEFNAVVLGKTLQRCAQISLRGGQSTGQPALQQPGIEAQEHGFDRP